MPKRATSKIGSFRRLGGTYIGYRVLIGYIASSTVTVVDAAPWIMG